MSAGRRAMSAWKVYRTIGLKTAADSNGSAAPVRRLRELTFGLCAVVASIRVNLLEAQSTRSTVGADRKLTRLQR